VTVNRGGVVSSVAGARLSSVMVVVVEEEIVSCRVKPQPSACPSDLRHKGERKSRKGISAGLGTSRKSMYVFYSVGAKRVTLCA